MVDERDAAKTKKALKFDLRAYAYDGAVRWVAARIYQGPTTDFRTPCDGLAPVCSTADVSVSPPRHRAHRPTPSDAVGRVSHFFIISPIIICISITLTMPLLPFFILSYIAS